MEKITEMYSKVSTIVNNNKYVVGAIIAIIIIGSILAFMFKDKIKERFQTGYSPNSEGEGSDDISSGGSKSAEIMMFSVDWCPHCKSAAPEWDNLVEANNGKTVNGHSIKYSKINCTEESPDVELLIKKYGIEGYPTIKLIKDGQVIDFDAKPTKDNLNKFLNTAI
jgi:thiol-disulfide isomerase/thioredoxin